MYTASDLRKGLKLGFAVDFATWNLKRKGLIKANGGALRLTLRASPAWP